MTGTPIRDSGDGIWDEGEWISWAWINEQIATQEPESDAFDGSEVQDPVIRQMMRDAIAHDETALHPSPLWGEIGERIAALVFGLTLSRAHAQGHDGRIGDDFVEVKTITPRKRRPFVRVKRAGNFNMLAVVRVNSDRRFAAKLVRREHLPKDNGGIFATLSWSTICALPDARGN